MWPSTRGRYGLRALVELARRGARGPVGLAQLAQAQGISKRYLEQIFSLLKAGGLVRSVRGAHGGYVLARSAADIPVQDVLESLGERLQPAPCVDAPGACVRESGCAAHSVWQDVAEAVEAILGGRSLQEVLDRMDGPRGRLRPGRARNRRVR